MWKLIYFLVLSLCFSAEVNLANQYYKVIWDNQHKIPVQTQHFLQPQDSSSTFSNKKYIKDNRVNSPAPASFLHSNYDRGHMVPSADMRQSPEANRQTYLITNIAPQRPQLNRFAWARLEKYIRRQEHNQHQNRLEVITGILGLHEKKLKNGVSIPKAFYKIIYNHKNKTIDAYIFPNDTAGKRLANYQVPLHKIEQLTGEKFFTNYPKNQRYLSQQKLAYFTITFIAIILCLLRLKKHGLTI